MIVSIWEENFNIWCSSTKSFAQTWWQCGRSGLLLGKLCMVCVLRPFLSEVGVLREAAGPRSHFNAPIISWYAAALSEEDEKFLMLQSGTKSSSRWLNPSSCWWHCEHGSSNGVWHVNTFKLNNKTALNLIMCSKVISRFEPDCARIGARLGTRAL